MSTSTNKFGKSTPKRGRPRNEKEITRIELNKDLFIFDWPENNP